MLSMDYGGLRVFIYSDSGQLLADTVVTAHNRAYMTILVQGLFRDSRSSEFIQALILADDGVHEYSGKLRSSASGPDVWEIALFRGKLRESRAARRYPINTPAVVDNILVDHQPIPLLNPIDVQVVNLSSTGILLSTQTNSFAMNTTLSLLLSVGNVNTSMQGRVVRIRELSPAWAEYGCCLVAAGRPVGGDEST